MNMHSSINEAAPLLEVKGLSVAFKRRASDVSLLAVDNVGFRVGPRETVGLVGESGSGKTTIGRAILGLTPITSGSVIFGGKDITRAARRQRRELAADLRVVFQDPYSSLNPTRTIGATLADAVRSQKDVTALAAQKSMRVLLEKVGLDPDAVNRYPTHFSGGQRQRIAIARALMPSPKLVICDEPVSALDLSVQAQVINLLRELQQDLGLSYLFIAHDLAVVRHISHRIVVLYRGRIMEHGDAAAVYDRPRHPYTQALLAAAPVPDPETQARHRAARRASAPRPGDFSAAAFESVGCPFAARCPAAIELCHSVEPALETTTVGTAVACHRWRELDRGLPALGPGPGIRQGSEVGL